MSWFVLDEIFVFETAVSETSIMFKQIKKLKLINKYADIQFFLLTLHSKPLFRKRRFPGVGDGGHVKLCGIYSTIMDINYKNVSS